RRYPLRVFLHGGTTVPDPGPGGSWWPDLDLVSGEGHISVMPLAWSECLWWQHGQVEALRHILLGIKRFYNVDENRVYLAGVSDGGAGTYFGAFHDTTPWAAFLPFVGHPGVLENAHYGVDGSTQVANLLNKPLFIVNTIQDPIHPAVSVHPYLELYGKAGVRFDYHELPGVHDVAWWPAEAEDIEAFLAAHPRDPLPDTVVWATEYVDRYNRAHWIVVDELGSASSGAAARRLTGFTSGRNAGIVSAIRDGNTFRVDTHGVRRLRILVSPDEVDLTLPVEVVVNGRTTFHGPLAPDVGTLLAWAAVDGDRTMLFAAEIRVDVPR
ncbi:MAG: hypothetical protein OEZ37_13705, partial [Gemmatimonadota bacterium]|nr:hypothetical protein [Gemmatimonadota bacterium]